MNWFKRQKSKKVAEEDWSLKDFVLRPEYRSKLSADEMCESMFLFLLGYGRSPLGSDRGFVSSEMLSEIASTSGLKLNGAPVIRTRVTREDDGRPLELTCTTLEMGKEVDIVLVADLKGVPSPREEMALLYESFMDKVEAPLRQRTWLILRQQIAAGETGTVALLPFIFFDRDTSLVSSVTLDYARFREPEWGDDLTGVRELLSIFESTEVQNRAAVFLGLLTLGDRRVTDLLKDYRSVLGRYEVKEVCISNSEFAHAPVIEFFLDWLKDLHGGNDDGRYGSVAGRVMRFAEEADRHEFVMDQSILFPSRPGRQNSVLNNEWSFEEYSSRVLPTLQKLALDEPEPRVLDLVIQSWRNV